MLLGETLFPHLRQMEQTAANRMECLMSDLTARTKLPDKATDPMGWASMMNSLRSRAEEMVLNELIYA
jgi:hypothetical protein